MGSYHMGALHLGYEELLAIEDPAAAGKEIIYQDKQTRRLEVRRRDRLIERARNHAIARIRRACGG
jgi:hypothetical protein